MPKTALAGSTCRPTIPAASCVLSGRMYLRRAQRCENYSWLTERPEDAQLVPPPRKGPEMVLRGQ
jgi:hypothetical protein